MTKKNLKNDFNNIMTMLKGVDNPHLNSIRNSIHDGVNISKISISVSLYKKKKVMFKAEVEIMASGDNLYDPALAVVLDELDQKGMKVKWDAVQFNNYLLWSKRSMEKSMDQILPSAIKEYRHMSLEEAVDDAVIYKDDCEELTTRLAAAILAQTIEIKSDQFPKPSKARKFLKKFRI